MTPTRTAGLTALTIIAVSGLVIYTTKGRADTPGPIEVCWPTKQGDSVTFTLQGNVIECSLMRREGHGRKTLVIRKELRYVR